MDGPRERERGLAHQTQRLRSRFGDGGRVRDGHGRVLDLRMGQSRLHGTCPLRILITPLLSPSFVPPCPLLLRFPFLLLLLSLFSFFFLWPCPLLGLRSLAASRVLSFRCGKSHPWGCGLSFPSERWGGQRGHSGPENPEIQAASLNSPGQLPASLIG